jgi:hypothetical protein
MHPLQSADNTWAFVTEQSPICVNAGLQERSVLVLRANNADSAMTNIVTKTFSMAHSAMTIIVTW